MPSMLCVNRVASFALALLAAATPCPAQDEAPGIADRYLVAR